MTVQHDLGFIVNDNKSQLKSSTKLTFLGFIIDSLDMKLYLTQDKIDVTISGLLVSTFPAVFSQ